MDAEPSALEIQRKLLAEQRLALEQRIIELSDNQKGVRKLLHKSEGELVRAQHRERYLRRLAPIRKLLLDWCGTRWIGVFVFYAVVIGLFPLAYAAHTLLGVLAAPLGLLACVAMVYPSSDQLPDKCRRAEEAVVATRETRDMLLDQSRQLKDSFRQAQQDRNELLAAEQILREGRETPPS